jgi:hypothetical protein
MNNYRILSFDDHYDEDNGILANVCRISDKRKFTLPLEDLEVVDRTSINYQILDDYSVWFVNYTTFNNTSAGPRGFLSPRSQ